MVISLCFDSNWTTVRYKSCTYLLTCYKAGNSGDISYSSSSSTLLHNVITTSYWRHSVFTGLQCLSFLVYVKLGHTAHVQQLNCCVEKCQASMHPMCGLQTAQISVLCITRSDHNVHFLHICYIQCDLFDCCISHYDIMPATLANTFMFILRNSALADLGSGGRYN